MRLASARLALCFLCVTAAAACGPVGDADPGDGSDTAGAELASISETEFADDAFDTPAEAEQTCTPGVNGLGSTCVGLAQSATPRFAGVFASSTQASKMVVDVTWSDFQDKWSTYSSQGYRLVDMDTRGSGSSRRYSGVYRPGSGAYYLWAGVSWTSFSDKWSTLSGQGMRLVDVETYVENGTRLYTGVWVAGSDAHYLWAGVTWPNFVAKWQDLAAKGLRLIDLEVYEENGALRYTGVWRAGSGGYALWVGSSWNGFAAKWMQFGEQGYRLVDLETYTFDGHPLYAGVFRAGSGAYDLVQASTLAQFSSRVSTLAAQNRRLVRIEADTNASAAPPGYARAFSEVLDGHAVGYAFAVNNNHTTISAGGIGYARAPEDGGEVMSSGKRTQLASVSKPLTAIGLMRLREMQTIDLDAPFLDYLDGSFTVGAGVSGVTVRNLMTHKSGMPASGSCGGSDFRDVLAELIAKPLVGTPGVTYKYSNANFCLVRAVIEDQTEMDYVDFMQTYVLNPAGVSAMTCTPDTISPILYYSYDSEDENGTSWTTDYTPSCAAYGWYASANDLAKILNALNTFKIVSSATRTKMLDEGLGWFSVGTVDGNGKGHNGAWIKNGKASRTGIVTLPNKVSAVLLVNSNGFDPSGILAAGYDYTATLGDP